MSGKESGYWRRLMNKLGSEAGDTAADDLSQGTEDVGATPASSCKCGDSVTVRGKLRSVELCPRDANATLEAELYDGTEDVTLVWLGRRSIPGIEPGRTIKVTGRMAVRDGRKVLYNPYYELQTTS
jgi:RecJ-like exonuclease